jgi:hypothetical protein
VLVFIAYPILATQEVKSFIGMRPKLHSRTSAVVSSPFFLEQRLAPFGHGRHCGVVSDVKKVPSGQSVFAAQVLPVVASRVNP